jgi:hypothetical protein
MTDLPQFVRDMLAAPPSRGGGLNNWFFRTARVLHAFRSPDEIIALLSAATHGEPLQHSEIERAVERSKAVAWKPGQLAETITRQPAWPAVNHPLRAKIITETGVGLYDLHERSPVYFDEDRCTETIIDALFAGNPRLCCGESKSRFWNRRREEFRGKLSNLALIVPSAMTARVGLTQEGRMSEHALSITGPRRYLVIEQDTGTLDEQAATLWHLAEFAPLILAVHSGGKSLHGWFRCPPHDAAVVAKFMRYAVSLGADPAPWVRSQFVRMPDGTRETGERQTVFFFDP